MARKNCFMVRQIFRDIQMLLEVITSGSQNLIMGL
jgi:hypothetical protein